MQLIFMGSGHFSVPSLRLLLDSHHQVAALITQPDKPAGRGHSMRLPPTKPIALDHSIWVHQPAKIRTEASVELIRGIAPDCIVVVAYGQIIPKAILNIPPKGIINVHGSLLPAYRGAAPIQWSIARGEEETGVCTMLMDEGLDTGPVLLERRLPIEAEDTGATLEAKLAPLGAELLLETLDAWAAGNVSPRAQDDARASLAPRIKKEDARIDWSQSAKEIERRVRAFIPWPVAFTELDGKEIKVYRSSLEPPGEASPGETVSIDREGVVVGCGGGTRLRLLQVQAQGKKQMAATDFSRGQRLAVGTRWGERK
jgi:methionyl-tRNA formyltransferase